MIYLTAQKSDKPLQHGHMAPGRVAGWPVCPAWPIAAANLGLLKRPNSNSKQNKKMSNDRTHFLQVNTPLAKSGHPDCCPEIPIVERFWYWTLQRHGIVAQRAQLAYRSIIPNMNSSREITPSCRLHKMVLSTLVSNKRKRENKCGLLSLVCIHLLEGSHKGRNLRTASDMPKFCLHNRLTSLEQSLAFDKQQKMAAPAPYNIQDQKSRS